MGINGLKQSISKFCSSNGIDKSLNKSCNTLNKLINKNTLLVKITELSNEILETLEITENCACCKDKTNVTNVTNVTKKTKRYKSTPQEEELLSVLESEQYKNFLPAEVTANLEIELKEYTDYWSRKRIYDRWYDRCRRKKKDN